MLVLIVILTISIILLLLVPMAHLRLDFVIQLKHISCFTNAVPLSVQFVVPTRMGWGGAKVWTGSLPVGR